MTICNKTKPYLNTLQLLGKFLGKKFKKFKKSGIFPQISRIFLKYSRTLKFLEKNIYECLKWSLLHGIRGGLPGEEMGPTGKGQGGRIAEVREENQQK